MVFKPKEYNHIIHMTLPTKMWTELIGNLETIFNEVCNYNNVSQSDYPEIVDFINKD